MEVHVLTVFPQYYRPFRRYGILAKALRQGDLSLRIWSLRRFTDANQRIDDRAYGGGRGMVMKPEPYFRAVDHIRSSRGAAKVLMTAPDGRQLTNQGARSLSKRSRFIIITGRYEGVDHRVREQVVDELWSVGSYVTPGGDLPALTILSAAIRFVPGVLGNDTSVAEDSFEDQQLDTPHYTRPASYRGHDVPEVLRSGDHQRIREWRSRQARRRTEQHRPDLLNSEHESGDTSRYANDELGTHDSKEE